jgi:hypothetical protein
MAGRRPIRTVSTMTTFAPPIPLPVDGREAARLDHPTRRHRWRDGKLRAMAAVDSLSGCRRQDLEVLAATADLIRVPAGAVLAEGWDFTRQWWMPLEGWLLAEGDSVVARTIPAGWSWVAPRFPATNGRLSSPRESRLLVAPVHRLSPVLDDNPRLGEVVRATLVGGDV